MAVRDGIHPLLGRGCRGWAPPPCCQAGSVGVVVFTQRMLPEVMDVFWGALERGETVTDAAKEVGTYREKGVRWIRAEGGIRPRRGRGLKGRCLTFSEREEIVLLRGRGESIRGIARRFGSRAVDRQPRVASQR